MKNSLIASVFFFAFVMIIITSGCDKHDEDKIVDTTIPQDTTITQDTMAHQPNDFELLLGSYRGNCYSYSTAFNYMTNEHTTKHDTFENVEVKLILNESWENQLAFTIGGDYFFYPDVFFFTSDYFNRDTVIMSRNISYSTSGLTWVKKSKYLHASQFNANYFSLTPGYSTFNCYCTKEE